MLLKELEIKDVKVENVFWKNYLKNIQNISIPYQYQVLNDKLDVEIERERADDNLPNEKSHAFENFKIAAGLNKGEHYGWFFQDSDVYKWIEATANSLSNKRNKELESLVDQVVDLIELAQEKDGYLNTYFQLKKPNLKYRELHYSHELYCAGHLIEASIAYDKAVNKNKLLNIAIKFVDNIKNHFGYKDNQIKGADGHQEIELALVKLYEYTNDLSYLELANFFIDIRGKDIKFYDKQIDKNLKEGLVEKRDHVDLVYLQAYKQPIKQKEAFGHAVRMLYMATAMAKISYYTNNNELFKTCEKLFNNIVDKKMYATGGVGSTVIGEAFESDYKLPNDTMYCETCAAIAMAYFSYEMYKITTEEKYFDIVELELYNGILSGASSDFKHFFYVNPLELDLEKIKDLNKYGHVKAKRPAWLGCACCPPNFLRTIGSINKYIYNIDEINNTFYINLFVGSKYIEGNKLILKQETNYPYQNIVKYQLSNFKYQTLKIRKPKWLEITKFSINEKEVLPNIQNDFIVLPNARSNDSIEIVFKTIVTAKISNEKVLKNKGLLALSVGPFILALENIDNSGDLKKYSVNTNDLMNSKLKFNDNILKVEVPGNYDNKINKKITFIPYYYIANRGLSNMQVYIKESK